MILVTAAARLRPDTREMALAAFAAQHTRDFGAAIAAYADGPVAVTRFEVVEPAT